MRLLGKIQHGQFLRMSDGGSPLPSQETRRPRSGNDRCGKKGLGKPAPGIQGAVRPIGKRPIFKNNLTGKFAPSNGTREPAPGLTRGSGHKTPGAIALPHFRKDGDSRAMRPKGNPFHDHGVGRENRRLRNHRPDCDRSFRLPKEVVFSAERMRWLYERGFGHGSNIVAVFDGDVKVGQMVLMHQRVCSGGETSAATQARRSLYSAGLPLAAIGPPHLQGGRAPVPGAEYPLHPRTAERERDAAECTFPQARSPALVADPRGRRILVAKPFNAEIFRPLQIDDEGKCDRFYFRALTHRQPENGLHWDANILFDRLSDPTCDYAVHATADLLLISSSRKTGGVRYALLCGFFVRSQAKVRSGHGP